MTVSTKNLTLRVTRKGWALINFKRMWTLGGGSKEFQANLRRELGA